MYESTYGRNRRLCIKQPMVRGKFYVKLQGGEVVSACAGAEALIDKLLGAPEVSLQTRV